MAQKDKHDELHLCLHKKHPVIAIKLITKTQNNMQHNRPGEAGPLDSEGEGSAASAVRGSPAAGASGTGRSGISSAVGGATALSSRFCCLNDQTREPHVKQ